MRLPYRIPPGLEEQRVLGGPWPAWIDGLPRLADEVTTEWGLSYDGEPLHGYNGFVLPVIMADGRQAALKLVLADAESAGEPIALRQWDGNGAVELWRADPRRGALLLEWLGPGDLNELDDLAACEVVAELYGLLHLPPHPRLPDVRGFVSAWLDRLGTLPRDAVPSRFVEQALAAGPRLLRDEPSVVIHGDLHYDNVMRGTRREWLAIDPKGFAGDPAYELAPMLWNRWDELGDDPGGRIRERFFTLVDGAGLDERRCRDWVVLLAVCNVLWEHEDAAGRPLRAEQVDWITRVITTAKAMQEI